MSLIIASNTGDGSRIIFSLWRRELALAAEIITDKDHLYTPEDKINWDYFAKQTDFLGYWKSHPGDPIWFILAHKDDEGLISFENLDELSKRLKELVPKLPGKEQHPNWQTMTKKFITTINKAYKEKENMLFS